MFFTATLLLAAIAAIVLLSAKFQWNVFFVLLIVAAGTGFAAGMPAEKIIGLLKSGIGGTIEKIGLLIILGITLGILLEKSGATTSLAHAIIKKVGAQNTPLALAIMGYTIGLPVFCDSGFVVLSGLMLSLSAQAPGKHLWMVIALASGLYAVHCLVPPHPGITAAAGTMQADLGMTMLTGAIVAIPVALAGYGLGRWYNLRLPIISPDNIVSIRENNGPAPGWAIVPVILPVLLIGLKSIVLLNPALPDSWIVSAVKTIGDPVVALLIGILCCLPLFRALHRGQLNEMLDTALSKAGNILLLTAAGGAFGEVIKAMDIGSVFGPALAASGLGLLVPFILAAVFKTAQGSSTVAVIAAAAILAPLLPALGLDDGNARVCALLAAGAGSMVISHTNDSYFWVVSRFSNVEMGTILRTYTVVTAVMGITGLVSVWLVYLLF